jgi:uncharacterized protein YfiM (DUF2279 family)
MRAFVSAVELLNPHRGTFAKLVGKRNQFADTTAHQNQYVADQERSTRRTVMARSALVSAVRPDFTWRPRGAIAGYSAGAVVETRRRRR